MSRIVNPGNRLLLVEPQFVLRRTVAVMARDMGLGDVREATSTAVAEKLLQEERFNALLIAIDDEGAALELLRQLRAGNTMQPADLLVAATAGACDVELALRLKQLDVCRLLLKPFKVRGVLEVIAALGAPAPLAVG
ncbi:MAG: response regulator [Roseateles sp.]|uniref:response regulator n=1 Tax=Roseateles sp. TaxID=1971397 RepID=UPI004035328E